MKNVQPFHNSQLCWCQPKQKYTNSCQDWSLLPFTKVASAHSSMKYRHSSNSLDYFGPIWKKRPLAIHRYEHFLKIFWNYLGRIFQSVILFLRHTVERSPTMDSTNIYLLAHALYYSSDCPPSLSCLSAFAVPSKISGISFSSQG